MKEAPLPTIPSPPGHLWRQFRFEVLPVIAFMVVLVFALWLWGRNLINPSVVGTAESVESTVSSPKSGWLSQLKVKLYEDVHVGDVIAVVDPLEPGVLSNTVALARAEMDAIRSAHGYNAGDLVRYEQFRLNVMERRVELIQACAQAFWASNELLRVSQLQKDQVDSPSSLDTAMRDFVQATKVVEERTTGLKLAQESLARLNPSQQNSNAPSMESTLAVAEQKIQLAEAQLQPIVVKAPISGRVYSLKKVTGEAVVAGEPILNITSMQVTRIIAYVGQPVSIEPKVGMIAEVRTRGPLRASGSAVVVNVGPRIEMFDAPLRVRGLGSAQERGLPFEVSAPSSLQLRDGELVDVRLKPVRPSKS